MEVARTPDRPWLPRPGDEGPPGPRDAGLAPWLQERLFAQRIVALRGMVTDMQATETVSILLSLDAAGPDPVQLHLSAQDGELNAVFAIIDAVEMLQSPVHALVSGEVGGGAVGILAAARKRAAHPHARFRLSEPALVGHAGTADEMAGVAGRHLQALEDLADRIAKASGQSLSRVEADLGRRLTMNATEAMAYGLIDEITGR
jgi:ATP-dependent Clp protease protease subunit